MSLEDVVEVGGITPVNLHPSDSLAFLEHSRDIDEFRTIFGPYHDEYADAVRLEGRITVKDARVDDSAVEVVWQSLV